MKITEITKTDNVYTVRFSPNWLGRLFGKKEKIEKFKKSNGVRYLLTGRGVYYNQKGEETGGLSEIGLALDNYDRSF